METWTKRIFLVAATAGSLALAAFPVAAAEDGSLIGPDVQPREIREPRIDTENFEIGVFAGVMSIEDFESSFLWGGRLTYHISDAFFMEANLGFAQGGETSFERLAGDVRLLPGDDRDYVYYNLNVGYNILPGEAFFPGGYAFNTNFYLVAGAGATDFAGDNRFTVNYGAGYQVLLTDSVSIHINLRQHVFETDILGEDKTAFNTEFSSGISLFF